MNLVEFTAKPPRGPARRIVGWCGIGTSVLCLVTLLVGLENFNKSKAAVLLAVQGVLLVTMLVAIARAKPDTADPSQGRRRNGGVGG